MSTVAGPVSGVPAVSNGASSRATSSSTLLQHDVRMRHGSVCDSVSSTLGGSGTCDPAPPASASGSFAWDGDGSHSHALVSPVFLANKKKGGLFSGLKKMFLHHKGERAATGQGQRDGAPDGYATSSDGTGGFLDPSITKAERSVRTPMGTKAQAGSNRDLTLAALITSPVRIPNSPVSNSPIPNSPMPSARFDHASSSNLGPHGDGEASHAAGAGNRLFPHYGSGSGKAFHPPPLSGEGSYHGIGSSSPFSSVSVSGRMGSPAGHPGHSHSQLTSSISMQLPAAFKVSGPHMHGQGPYQKSHTNLPHNHSTGGGGSGHHTFVRGDSADEYPQSNPGSGHSGRLALPHLAGPRHHQEQSAVASPGRGGRGVSSVSEVAAEGCDEAEEAEEEDEAPGTMLLGMNPSVPPGMRRRRWSLDDYQVVKRMYKGSTSAVYRAVCLRSGITVALKVYFLNRVPINVVHMIRREIELHVPLVHRNIIMLYAAFQDEKHIVLVEEFAARGDLFGIHRSMNCRLAESQTSELILAPFLDALAYLHARGIMHRDIKPENILFTQDWALKIADFGVSINVNNERAVTRTGTADYMAPEVERCPLKHAPEDNKDNTNLAYTTAIDIWSVGVLAYEMLVGFPPFVSNGAPGQDDGGASSLHGVAAFMAEQATRKTLRFPASVSAAAKDFIMATLAENPGDRPTALQLLKHPWLFKVARRPSTNSTSRFSNPNLVLGPY